MTKHQARHEAVRDEATEKSAEPGRGYVKHIDPELFEFHFGSKIDRAHVESLMNDKQVKCHILKVDFCSYSAFVRETDSADLPLTMLGRFCDQLRDLVIDSGGMVDRVHGDGVLAMWGFGPEVSAEKVFKTKVDVLVMAKQIADEWQDGIDHIIERRGGHAGLAYGLVSLIDVPTGYPGFSVLSESVNLAARLEQLAGAGEICVSNRFENLLPKSLKVNLSPIRDDEDISGVLLRNVGRIQAFRYRAVPS